MHLKGGSIGVAAEAERYAITNAARTFQAKQDGGWIQYKERIESYKNLPLPPFWFNARHPIR
ncbi:hypothetical protein [uncultured Odoribacter sp.]|uniref:hypothetical protein n=1 Tax=uncultured Odoribacter sp. TaxID=876416 RepID=UPI0026160FB0|nr:hypothetical protein [uncultured Odoribacter sp.]